MNREFGRNFLRPWAHIASTGLLALMIALTICYPFPLRMSDIPKKSAKAFSAVVITNHEGGFVQGWRITDSARETFRVPEGKADAAILKQLRKFDLANSRAFRTLYWVLLALMISLRFASAWLTRLFPDRPEMQPYVPESSMAEYKRYMANRFEALLPPPRKAEEADRPRGDRWYRRPYWHEVAMGCVMLLVFGFSFGFWRYLNPDVDRAGINMKAAAKNVGSMKLKTYPDGDRRSLPAQLPPE